MKKTIRTVTLFAVLALTAAGCQKENTMPNNDVIAHSADTVVYFTGTETGTVYLFDDTAWDLFLNRMMALAKEGYTVSLTHGTSANQQSTKETVVYHTDNEDDAKRWAKEMFDKGYDVDIIFDEETGTWTCIATN